MNSVQSTVFSVHWTLIFYVLKTPFIETWILFADEHALFSGFNRKNSTQAQYKFNIQTYVYTVHTKCSVRFLH